MDWKDYAVYCPFFFFCSGTPVAFSCDTYFFMSYAGVDSLAALIPACVVSGFVGLGVGVMAGIGAGSKLEDLLRAPIVKTRDVDKDAVDEKAGKNEPAPDSPSTKESAK